MYPLTESGGDEKAIRKDREMARNKGKKLILLAGIMVGITAISTLITYGINPPQKNTESKVNSTNLGENKIDTIITSFYPMYIAALNLTDGIEGIKVENLMNQQVGCPHDYELTTSDMKKLEEADMLIINGGDMESYVEEVAGRYKNLILVDSSENISLLEGEEHSHEDSAHEEGDNHDHEEEHDHGAANGHIWMDPTRYMLQLENITRQLIANDSVHKEQYEENLKLYKQRIMKAWSQYEELGTSKQSQVIIFHNAMEYLMESLGVEVVYSVDIDGETSLSAGEIAEVIEEIRAHDIKVLFIEAQFDSNIANRISEETGAKVYVLDTMVSGELTKDAYINSLKYNLSVLKEALYQ